MHVWIETAPVSVPVRGAAAEAEEGWRGAKDDWSVPLAAAEKGRKRRGRGGVRGEEGGRGRGEEKGVDRRRKRNEEFVELQFLLQLMNTFGSDL